MVQFAASPSRTFNVLVRKSPGDKKEALFIPTHWEGWLLANTCEWFPRPGYNYQAAPPAPNWGPSPWLEPARGQKPRPSTCPDHHALYSHIPGLHGWAGLSFPGFQSEVWAKASLPGSGRETLKTVCTTLSESVMGTFPLLTSPMRPSIYASGVLSLPEPFCRRLHE